MKAEIVAYRQLHAPGDCVFKDSDELEEYIKDWMDTEEYYNLNPEADRYLETYGLVLEVGGKVWRCKFELNNHEIEDIVYEKTKQKPVRFGFLYGNIYFDGDYEVTYQFEKRKWKAIFPEKPFERMKEMLENEKKK